MWLLPFFSLVANLAARTFYRLRTAGLPAPRHGPVLLVANHPNALLDPALVAAAARRPVRFLAKAPLFEDRLVGWLIRGVGAIPVYRQVDDPQQMERNREMFRAGIEALAAGAAIGLFPEGTSHSDPAIKPLKTGAARLALGAARDLGQSFPIVPLGLVFRQKERFRSPAMVVLGPAVDWADLARASEPEDRETVLRLTERIDEALRGVTVNMQQWQDEPLLRCAEAIWRAAHAQPIEESSGLETKRDRSIRQDEQARHIQQLGVAARLLEDRRSHSEQRDPTLPRDLAKHGARLEGLGLSPASLTTEAGLKSSVLWTVSRLYLLGLPALFLATFGYLIYYLPFHLTGKATALANPPRDQVATYKLLIGALVYSLWVILIAAAAGLLVATGRLWHEGGLAAGLVAAAATFFALPWIGMAGLWIREHWRGTARDLRQFFFLRSRRRLVQRLQQRQKDLAARIAAAVNAETV